MNRIFPVIFLIWLFLPHPVGAASFDHSIWNILLKDHVRTVNNGVASQVDYSALAGKRQVLGQYLTSLAAVKREEFDSWSADEQLAFLINAYNSWTVELILTKYPDLESIKDLGSLFRSPWKKQFIPLLGEERSLDDIEHGLIRGSGRYNDPRIHFAVNCASVGCPALRPEAYEGDTLQGQLAEAASLFLQDRSRNRLRDGSLEVSLIFKWYREDFEQGWMGSDSLNGYFASHSDDLNLAATDKKRLLSGNLNITFLDYDWNLNGIK